MKEGVAAARPLLGFSELVGLVAAVMALNALAIDMMLPALGTIGAELGAAQPNDRQLVIVVYVVGNGFGQILFGPVVDRFGRRPVLLASLAGYVVLSAFSVVASTFMLLLAARALQGVATAAARVAVVATVRDLSAGRRMAEVMSLAVTIFMAAPILAPGFGQLVLFVAPWRAIFFVLLLYGAALTLWVYWRTPETMAPGSRTPLNLARIAGAYGEFLGNRMSFGYTLASALGFGALFAYISASEQVFVETFDLGPRFPLAFAGVAASLGAATLLNARIVGRAGMRRLTHGALVAFAIANLIHWSLAAGGMESLPVFMAFMMVSFFCLGLVGSNSAALALEPMGHIAGAAAAANGFAGTTIAGAVGGFVARLYDGTTTPLVAGFAVLGWLALGVALWTERGRLFEAHAAGAAK